MDKDWFESWLGGTDDGSKNGTEVLSICTCELDQGIDAKDIAERKSLCLPVTPETCMP
jgi:hypothetical protein